MSGCQLFLISSSLMPLAAKRFHASRLLTYYPSEFHQQHNIPYVKANLIALKTTPDIPEFGGPQLI